MHRVCEYTYSYCPVLRIYNKMQPEVKNMFHRSHFRFQTGKRETCVYAMITKQLTFRHCNSVWILRLGNFCHFDSPRLTFKEGQYLYWATVT